MIRLSMGKYVPGSRNRNLRYHVFRASRTYYLAHWKHRHPERQAGFARSNRRILLIHGPSDVRQGRRKARDSQGDDGRHSATQRRPYSPPNGTDGRLLSILNHASNRPGRTAFLQNNGQIQFAFRRAPEYPAHEPQDRHRFHRTRQDDDYHATGNRASRKYHHRGNRKRKLFRLHRQNEDEADLPSLQLQTMVSQRSHVDEHSQSLRKRRGFRGLPNPHDACTVNSYRVYLSDGLKRWRAN